MHEESLLTPFSPRAMLWSRIHSHSGLPKCRNNTTRLDHKYLLICSLNHPLTHPLTIHSHYQTPGNSWMGRQQKLPFSFVRTGSWNWSRSTFIKSCSGQLAFWKGKTYIDLYLGSLCLCNRHFGETWCAVLSISQLQEDNPKNVSKFGRKFLILSSESFHMHVLWCLYFLATAQFWWPADPTMYVLPRQSIIKNPDDYNSVFPSETVM